MGEGNFYHYLMDWVAAMVPTILALYLSTMRSRRARLPPPPPELGWLGRRRWQSPPTALSTKSQFAFLQMKF